MIVLGPNRYGKAETRLVRVTRHGDAHHLKDLNVSVSLSGDLADVHLRGDNSAVLPTDTQKNTVYAFAKKHGVGAVEDFALLLARRFVDSRLAIHHARVAIEEYPRERDPEVGHSFVRSGREIRTAVVHHGGDGTHVVSGLRGLAVLNSTDSEFRGFARDEYTTLAEARDRVLATVINARWRHAAAEGDWDASYAHTRSALLAAFARTYSRSLQQTLYAMGARVLGDRPEICEIRLTLPNKHHVLVDLSPFGLRNDNEVFHAADRPYGLIEGTVLREDAPDPGPAWS